MPREVNFSISPRPLFDEGQEPPEPLQCNSCGGFFKPTHFQKEIKRVESTEYKETRRNFCIKCPGTYDKAVKDKKPDADKRKLKYAYEELLAKISNLEAQLKEQDIDMNRFANAIKTLTSRIAILESSRDQVLQGGIAGRARKFDLGD
jgi:hypothetical protein